MAKPIFLVSLPSIASREQAEETQTVLDGKLDDYHCLVLPGNSEEAKFLTFYEKDLNEIKFNELKQLVKTHLESLTSSVTGD